MSGLRTDPHTSPGTIAAAAEADPGSDPASIPLLAAPLPGPATSLSRGSGHGSRSPWPSLTAPHQPREHRPPAASSIRAGVVGRVHRGPDVDWALVARLRTQASDRLSQAVPPEAAQARLSRGGLDQAGQEELARKIIFELIDQTRGERADAGDDPLTLPQQHELAQAVFDALFRLGRLQPLVDDDRVENVELYGCDQVYLHLTDGHVERGPAVADSDEQLIADLQFLASRSRSSARTFSEAEPRLHLMLDDGSRLTATAWVTPRPQVNIRRHRLVQVTLTDLVARDLLPPLAASFLAAAVRDRRSIVVTGSPGAGKTTLVRALAAEIGPAEPIATIETEYELHLHAFRARVRPWQARYGSGEVGSGGRRAGQYTLMDAIEDSVRYNVSRTIVGEVRGGEAMAMIKSMENGAGCLSTTHARDAVAGIAKLVTCAQEAGTGLSAETVTDKLAAAVDLIVHIDLSHPAPEDAFPGTDGTARLERDGLGADPADDVPVRRRVTEIVAVARGDRPGTAATTHVFALDAAGTLAPGVLPDEYRRLARWGFDLDGYAAQAATPVGVS